MGVVSYFKKWNKNRVDARRWSVKRSHQDLSQKLLNLEMQITELRQAIADPNGFSFQKMRFNLLRCPEKYESIFFQLQPGEVVIDGGANLGLFTDLMLGFGAKVITYEPNPVLMQRLRYKYSKQGCLVETLAELLKADNNFGKCLLVEKAISTKNSRSRFSMATCGSFVQRSQAGSMCFDDFPDSERLVFDVETVDFCDFLSSFGKKEIGIIKLDIEGAEFDVLEKILSQHLHSKFGHLFCETHERYFSEGDLKLNALKNLISENGVSNIHLDWY